MNLYLYVLNTLADWEIGYLTAEVYSGRYFSNHDTECHLIMVGKDRNRITTMGGMGIMPDIAIDEMRFDKADMLVLPGSNMWMSSANDGILEEAKKRIENDMPVAAICGATVGLARMGQLNHKKHTSNDLGFLKYVAKEYSGESLYVNQPAVNDRNLITASGQSALAFTYEIIKALGLFKPDTLEAWRNLNLTNEARYFYDMIKSLEPENR